jgi:hypothetical protein
MIPVVLTIHGYDWPSLCRRFSVRNTGGLLLGPPDEQDSLGPAGGLEGGQVLLHDIVLALPLGEVDQRHASSAAEVADRRGERLADRRQRRGRGDRQPQLPVHEAHDPARELQLRHVHVQEHPVDALDLEHHVLR